MRPCITEERREQKGGRKEWRQGRGRKSKIGYVICGDRARGRREHSKLHIIQIKKGMYRIQALKKSNLSFLGGENALIG